MATEVAKSNDRAAAMDLFFAVSEGSVDKVKALLDSRVDPNYRDYQQRCPLHVAAGFGQKDIVELLLDYKADVNANDCWGQTPIDEALQAGHSKVERFLKINGAKLQKVVRMQKKATKEKFEIKRSEIELGEQLAKTLKSEVYRATWNGVQVVAKMVGTKDANSPEGSEVSTATPEEYYEVLEEEIVHEIALLTTIRHPDLVMFLGCCLTEKPYMLISQYMPGGDLEHYYAAQTKEQRVDGSPWTPVSKTINCWSRATLRALHFLHNCQIQIIHRDLKPMNILLTETLDVKLSDFGISKTIKRSKSGKLNRQDSEYVMTGGIGSYRYMAPEVARYESYSEKVDIYAFGLTLYFMCTGRRPFYKFTDVNQLVEEFRDGKEPRPSTTDCPYQFRPIMESAWHVDQEKRPSAAQLGERLVECSTPIQRRSCASLCREFSSMLRGTRGHS